MFIVNIAEYVKDLSIFGWLFSAFAFYCIFLFIKKVIFR